MAAQNTGVLYHKIKRTIFIVVTSLVALASILFYQYSLMLLQNRAEQADMQILKTHKEASEVMHRLGFNITQQVYNDRQIAYLLYNTNFNSLEVLRSIAQLNNYRSCIPYIESIYVYNEKLGCMTVSSPHSGTYNAPMWEAAKESELFFDRGVADILNGSPRLHSRYAPVPRKILYGEPYKKDAFCYTFVAGAVYGDKSFREAVLINFSNDWMRQITKENAGSQSHTLVINDEGLVVFSAVDAECLQSIAGEPVYQSIMERGNQAISFLAPFAGEKMLVSVLPADANHWRYLRLTPYRYIMQNVLGFLLLILGVDAGLVLLGILSTQIAAKRLYIPIVAINRRLDYTEKERETLTGQQTLRKQLLRSAEGNNAAHDSSCEQGTGYVLLIRVEGYAELCDRLDSNERGRMMTQLADAARAMFTGNYEVSTLEMDEGLSVALVLTGETDHTPEYWQNTFAKLSVRLQAAFGVRIRGALSLHEKEANWKARCYRQAREAMRYRIFPQQDSLILWQHIQGLSSMDYVYPQEKENLMIDQLMNGNADAAKASLHKILEAAVQYTLTTVQMTVSTLTIALLNITEEIRRSNFVTLSPMVRESLLAVPSLDDVEIFDDVSAHFETIIDQICLKLGDRREARHIELLERVNVLIENNYQDPNCSLAFVAEQANMSAAYLGRLYKHYTLHGVPEAIADVRMNRARQLLVSDHEMTIEQIAQNVGFSSGSYFSKAFRKEHGMTPNEWRTFAQRDMLPHKEEPSSKIEETRKEQ